MYFNRYGEPTTMWDWVAQNEHKVLRQTFVRQYMISTVYLGLDFSIFFGHVPLIFETMVFDDYRGASDLECWRYPTLATAHMGHVEVVSMVLHLSGSEWSDIHLDIDSRPALTGRPVHTVTPALIGGTTACPSALSGGPGIRTLNNGE